MSTNFGNYYNTAEVKANAGFEDLPPGEYAAIATEGEIVDTKDGTGKLVKFKFQIIEGDKKDCVVFNNYNIINKKEEVAAIGRGQLKDFATKLGKPNATDAAELLNIPFRFTYGKQKKNPEYSEVKSIMPYGSATVSSANTEKPAWMK